MPEPKRPLKVFLCHAYDDKPKARELYHYLKRRGIQPWLDAENLLAGQDWQVEIPKAIASSDAIIICLSKNSVDKEGYVQKEIKFALDKALEMPEGRIFIIPARFEECEVPDNLRRYHWVDLFDDGGYEKLMKSLKVRAVDLKPVTLAIAKTDESMAKIDQEKVKSPLSEKEAFAIPNKSDAHPLKILVTGGTRISRLNEKAAFFIGRQIIICGHFLINNETTDAGRFSGKGALEACNELISAPEKLILDGSVDNSDIVIILGGGDGTRKIVTKVLNSGKLLIPISLGDTATVSSSLWEKMLTGMMDSPIEVDDLRKIGNKQNPEVVALNAVILAEKLCRISSMPNHSLEKRISPSGLFAPPSNSHSHEPININSNSVIKVSETRKENFNFHEPTTPHKSPIKPTQPVSSKSKPSVVKSTSKKLEDARHKRDTAIVVAIIGAAATIIAALIGILPQFIKPAPLPMTTITATISVTQAPTATLTALPPSETPTLGSTTPGLTPTGITLTPTPCCSTWISPIDGMTMMSVPAGPFTMGSAFVNAPDERPIHTVTLKAFWIDQTEVTNAMYAKCVQAGKCQPPTSSNSDTRSSYYGNPKFDNFPVIYVNWNMAKTYCEYAGRRLPTEAEWEKAARGTDQRTYPWGEGINCDKANYYDGGKYCIGDTNAVGSYESGKSVYGVYDMTGNVWEWVSSLYILYPYSASDGREDLNAHGSNRVYRGGSWFDTADNARTTVRFNRDPVQTDRNLGFRCAQDAKP
jgi:formylglycine-generating enzyme required for sulfatase activity